MNVSDFTVVQAPKTAVRTTSYQLNFFVELIQHNNSELLQRKCNKMAFSMLKACLDKMNRENELQDSRVLIEGDDD
jgi:hypothetical protein